MKQCIILLLAMLLLASCFSNKKPESASGIPIDSIAHYYAIELDEKDSFVKISFTAWSIKDRNKRLLIPSGDKVEINGQIIPINNNNSYYTTIPRQNITNNIIILSYFVADTVFYSKRIQLARFYTCTVNFNATINNDIEIQFEPALSTFETLDAYLKAGRDIHKQMDYSEAIENGILIPKNQANYYGPKNKRIPTITLKKIYTETYTTPMQIKIHTSTTVERNLKDEPVIKLVE